MAKFVTLHHVDVHAPGEVVEIGREVEKAGVDIKRLLGLGAIRPAEGDEGKDAVAYGTPSDAALIPIPAVVPVNAAGYPDGVLPSGAGAPANPDAKPVGNDTK